LGAALLVATTTTLVLIFDRRTHEIIGASAKFGLAFMFLGCLAGLLMHESRTNSPFINLQLFKVRRFSFSALSLLIVAICYTLTGFLMPFYLQGILHLSPSVVGLLFMAPSILTVALAPVSGYMTDRLGPRVPRNARRRDYGRCARNRWYPADGFALVFTDVGDNFKRVHQWYFQSSQFHGDDRYDGQGTSRLRLIGESRHVWPGKYPRCRHREHVDGGGF
jgi:MFS transporter